ncbi:MAG: hypothetical protein KF690_00320 [Bacteroidetes bacterium]|nr:hypothetical protein [Bacteroidota bacterium]
MLTIMVPSDNTSTLQGIDPQSVNMVILWNSTGEMDIYHANMTVNSCKREEAQQLLDTLRIHGVTIVEMD